MTVKQALEAILLAIVCSLGVSLIIYAVHLLWMLVNLIF